MIAFIAGSSFVDVKDPDFRDKKEATVHVKVRTMMNGSLRTRRTTPAVTTFVLGFTDVTLRKREELKAFIFANQGKRLRYIDFEGVSWYGFLIEEPTIFKTVARGQSTGPERAEAVSFGLTFEVVSGG